MLFIICKIKYLKVKQMIKINHPGARDIFDQWSFLGPRRKRILKKSWAEIFRLEVLPKLPAYEFSLLFSDITGRPTKELFTVLGVVLLQQMHDLTDEETINQLSFNTLWHYALNITEESDSAKYMCPRTLWEMRDLVARTGFDKCLFERVTSGLAKAFKVETSAQRLDSVHVKSNMRKIGRIGILAAVILKFLVNLKRHHSELYHDISDDLKKRYQADKKKNCFGLTKPSDTTRKLQETADDLFHLINLFSTNADICAMSTYKCMQRVLSEQCEIMDDEGFKIVLPRKPKDIPSDSLQNPSDEDAAYSGHKGQGYQVQIMETYSEIETATDSETDNPEKKPLSLITHVELEKADCHDSAALIPAIKKAASADMKPEKLIADSLYGSDENIAKAESLGIEVISPAMGKEKSGVIVLSDFTFDNDGHVSSCPAGHSPETGKVKKDRFTQGFCTAKCANCPRHENCPVKEGRKYHYLRYTAKEKRLAVRRQKERTGQFRDQYRWRAGIEATMSMLDRKTGIKKLRYRGFAGVRLAVTLKALAINIFRAAAALNASFSAILISIFTFFKELLLKIGMFWHSCSKQPV